MQSTAKADNNSTLRKAFNARRDVSIALTEGLSAEDMLIQSMDDASPTKWHLAHTSWFFEEFILKKYQPGYTPINPEYGYLFNSYYNSVGEQHHRPQRGMLSRPNLDEVLAYRQAVDAQINRLLDQQPNPPAGLTDTLTVGLHHEMQHQELLLTDILHALSLNPTHPVMKTAPPKALETSPTNLDFIEFDEGLFEIGTEPYAEFSFDCEGPKHHYYVQRFQLANRPVTNAEWMAFIDDGGYQNPLLWLSDGWAHCQQHGWSAPLYWQQHQGAWYQFSLHGLKPLDPAAPVCHISYFEADAFAQWAQARLPTEQEWEIVARQQPITGNFQENQQWQPQPAAGQGLLQLFGDVWEWTRSPYTAYPGFKALPTAIGEYNGKFMCGQFVLRGGSCVTPIEQLRPSYRNFFYPHQRWQFSGLRLAKDV